MITIKFGRWNHTHNKKWFFKRIYINGYKWTPFVKVCKASNARKINRWLFGEFYND